ncbi:MAG: DUF2269 family protein [Candidatus Diapherotrites archaeon]|nr:DUF2269 family protein [Candidatus Diapherotrites archaeon]
MLLEIFNFLHFIGLAWGVGGATAAAIISMKAEKNPEVAASLMKIIPALSKLIWAGLVLLIISGIAVTSLVKWPLDTNLLLIKHALVVLIVAIGALIFLRVKKMQKLAKPGEKPSEEFFKAKKQLGMLSITNLALWYLIVLISAFV